jgi:hypothetical protein
MGANGLIDIWASAMHNAVDVHWKSVLGLFYSYLGAENLTAYAVYWQGAITEDATFPGSEEAP